jgi:hypothetical protein
MHSQARRDRRTDMTTKPADVSHRDRLEREVERERQQRQMNDDAKAGLGPLDGVRTKDARENAGSANLKRPH